MFEPKNNFGPDMDKLIKFKIAEDNIHFLFRIRTFFLPSFLFVEMNESSKSNQSEWLM
jgi:hypothetical protein